MTTMMMMMVRCYCVDVLVLKILIDDGILYSS